MTTAMGNSWKNLELSNCEVFKESCLHILTLATSDLILRNHRDVDQGKLQDHHQESESG